MNSEDIDSIWQFDCVEVSVAYSCNLMKSDWSHVWFGLSSEFQSSFLFFCYILITSQLTIIRLFDQLIIRLTIIFYFQSESQDFSLTRCCWCRPFFWSQHFGGDNIFVYDERWTQYSYKDDHGKRKLFFIDILGDVFSSCLSFQVLGHNL